MKQHLLPWPIPCPSGYFKEDVPKYDRILTHEYKKCYPIFVGALGQTNCCGAVSMLMPRMPQDALELIDLFKSTSKSIIHYIGVITGVYGDQRDWFPNLLKEANRLLAGCGEITMQTIELREHLLIFQVKDIQKTRDFFAGMK